jgi:hypothetical protein
MIWLTRSKQEAINNMLFLPASGHAIDTSTSRYDYHYRTRTHKQTANQEATKQAASASEQRQLRPNCALHTNQEPRCTLQLRNLQFDIEMRTA